MSESHVERQVQARIAAAKQRNEDMRRRRAEFAAARRRGLAARHAQKLRNQASRQQEPSSPTTDEVPVTTDDGSDRGDTATVATEPTAPATGSRTRSVQQLFSGAPGNPKGVHTVEAEEL